VPASKRQPTRAHRHDSAGSTSRVAALRQEAGFSLIEVLVASVILVVGLITLFGLLETSLKASASTRAREGASNLAREILEDTRTIPLAQISPGAIVGELQALHGLASASSGSWQIVRRGVTYTVLVKECAIDDPKDGLGKHPSASGENPFCQDPGEAEYKVGEAIEDPHPENLKRITAEVTWPAKGRKPFVTQVETLTSAGEAPGLNTSQLKVIKPTVAAPTAPVIISPGTASLVFSAQAPASTTAMEWALDGVRQTNPPTHISGTEWQFSWEIPLPAVSDGAYQVSVQAIDATGVYGPPVSISVTLIRTVPAAPKVTYGGFNEVLVAGVKKQVVELQWQPNTERNVIGYRVYNPSPSNTLVCPESLQSSCVDLLQVAGSPTLASANLTYSVVALYHNHVEPNVQQLSASVSEGPPGTFTLSKTPLAPKVPENGALEATTLEGAATLSWKPPVGGWPVVFYRIYRGTQNYTPGRYAVVSSATTTFTDNHAVEKATYWVTAVSATMTESPFTASVTLP
jgi:prepilin-type N-terminal cleavage/methylation domain-containing protein